MDEYPEASEVILRDFYVDDLLTGASTPEHLVGCKKVSDILKSGGMVLRKWVANNEFVQNKLNGGDMESGQKEFGERHTNKTLGLWWNFKDDTLRFCVEFSCNKQKTSKRSILSEISKIFDPLGLVGPTVVLAKILIQKLWQEKVGWDDTLPAHLETEWARLKHAMSLLKDFVVLRKVVGHECAKIELHGFCDASMQSYGACVYVKSLMEDGKVSVELLCSKVKVSPLKKLTIPRLELCAALLLAKLMDKVIGAMTVDIDSIWLWCDSTVVLSWINTVPHKLNVFVGNRISQIQDLTDSKNWRYIRSKENPADILSRGMYPEQLIKSSSWWNGPTWLLLDKVEWFELSQPTKVKDVPELKVNVVSVSSCTKLFPFEKFSSLPRLQRALCHILRYVAKFKNRRSSEQSFLTSSELKHAMLILVKLAQQEMFEQDFKDLSRNKLPTNRKLQGLSPFIDDEGMLRVGGRLNLSNTSFSKKHPLLLMSKHQFTKMLVEIEHRRLLHAGPQLVLSSLREKYWIIGGRNLVRACIHSCINCFKVKPVPLEQIMGQLPKERVNPAPPFYVSGVDYAGPFLVKDRYGRGSKTSKCYLCVFICFTTKAIHLEVVSSLSADAFIACFRRFSARRGKPSKIFSDNGSNFIGANSELKELCTFLQKQSNELSDKINREGVNWSFIPSKSPNFGGLWEAGVRSCKFHLKRILGNAVLTYEDLSTVLVQIEAVLNSRPLTAMSPDPNDFEALTPGHFLIGRPLTSLPDPDLQHVATNRLSRYQHLQLLLQQFWSRWSREYLPELQKKTKWTREQHCLEEGQLVIVKDNNLPPLMWRLGRVMKVYEGPDAKVRVASVKTIDGVYKRPITKLCPLPTPIGTD